MISDKRVIDGLLLVDFSAVGGRESRDLGLRVTQLLLTHLHCGRGEEQKEHG